MLKQYFFNRTKRTQQITSVLVVLIVAIVGTYLLMGSHAATPYASITADKGTLTGGATTKTCSGTSDGSCVVFGSTPYTANIKCFGVSMSCDLICYQTTANQNAEFSDIAAAGAKWVRFDAFWSEWEPSGANQYDQSNIDAFNSTVAVAEAHGLNVLPVLWSTPSWANGGQGVNVPPTNIADWTNYVTTVVNDEKSHINYWEIWNEENSTNFFTGTVAQYTQLLVAADEAIKAADPTAVVLLGGMTEQGGSVTQLSTSIGNWLEGVYDNGGGGHFDAVAVHPYTGGSTNSTGTESWNGWYQMEGSSPSIRSIMIAHGDGNKPIWGTEWGYNLSGYLPAATESVIQQNIPIDVNNWNSYPWSGVLFWYTDTDDNSTGGYGLSLPGFPIVHRPRWTTYRSAISQSMP